MKGKRLIFTVVALVAILVIGASPVLAAGKPPDVIAKSNGFPSGMHFNLNIHGVLDLYLEDPCTHEAGGNSVFIELYGDSIIQYQSGKKMSVTELIAIDPCASDDGKVAVQLPSKVQVFNETTGLYDTVAVAGYTVYGRILAKPQNGKTDLRSNILFSPNRVTEAYDTDETLALLGLITWDATYYSGPDQYFYRFEDPTATAKGKSPAREMTQLFTYTGWVVSDLLDTYEPDLDQITVMDIPERDWDNNVLTPPNRDVNGDTLLNDADIEAWLTWVNDESLARHYNGEWIFNIADFVTTEGDISNDGTKLFQVRFYPYFE